MFYFSNSWMRKLTVITWNIWFSRLERHIRQEEVLRICKKLEPDVICLQEVIPTFLDKVKASPFFTERYSFSDPNLDGSSIEKYGVLVMSKNELKAKYSIIDLPSIYWRKLVIAEVSHDDDKLAIGSVHLESLNSHPTREKQLEICNNALKNYKHSLLCGDFNFCSHSNYNGRGPLENNSLRQKMPEYVDVWPKLKPDQLGFTFDTVANPMAGSSKEQMRYDRIVYRNSENSLDSVSNNDLWRASNIRIIGDAPIKKDQAQYACEDYLTVNVKGHVKEVPLFPSDHFGLYAEFEKSNLNWLVDM